MHTTKLRSDAFQITVAGRPATIADVFPGFDAQDRLGIVVTSAFGAAGAGSLILAAVTAFYDCLRATGEDFFAYADYFAFHVGADHGTLRKLDVYPGHKEVVVPADAEVIVEAINDRGVTRLLVPDGDPAAPDLARETLDSARRRIRTTLAYSPTGEAARRRRPCERERTEHAYIRAMLGGRGMEVHEAQSFRRLGLDEALGVLPAARG